MISAIRTALNGLWDLILPGVCAACQANLDTHDSLCDACNLELLQRVSADYCPRCGTTLGPNIPVYDDGCRWCPNPLPRFDRVVRLGAYEPPLSSAIKELKFHRRGELSERLVRLLAEAVRAACTEPGRDELPLDLVIPVPMHWRRRLARGMDHTTFLADQLAARLDVPLGEELIRLRNTPPQLGLPKSRRLTNVRGAFGVRNAAAVRGARILLLDDVATTGATADESARTLLRTGALRVTLAILAKAQPPQAYAEQTESGEGEW
jgi:ComF family protein